MGYTVLHVYLFMITSTIQNIHRVSRLKVIYNRLFILNLTFLVCISKINTELHVCCLLVYPFIFIFWHIMAMILNLNKLNIIFLF